MKRRERETVKDLVSNNNLVNCAQAEWVQPEERRWLRHWAIFVSVFNHRPGNVVYLNLIGWFDIHDPATLLRFSYQSVGLIISTYLPISTCPREQCTRKQLLRIPSQTHCFNRPKLCGSSELSRTQYLIFREKFQFLLTIIQWSLCSSVQSLHPSSIHVTQVSEPHRRIHLIAIVYTRPLMAKPRSHQGHWYLKVASFSRAFCACKDTSSDGRPSDGKWPSNCSAARTRFGLSPVQLRDSILQFECAKRIPNTRMLPFWV